MFQVSDHPVVELVDDPTVPSRELEWAKALQPFMVSLGGGDKDLVILPPAALAPHATTAIQALAYEGAAKMLGMDLPYALVARQDAVCRILSHFAHAEDLLYQIFQLAPSFAQALRIHLLTQPPLTVGQDSCRLQFPSG